MNAGKNFSTEQAELREAMVAKLHDEHQGVLKVEAMITSSMEGVQQTMTERAIIFKDEEIPLFEEINDLLRYLTGDQRKRLAEIVKTVIEPRDIEDRLKDLGLEVVVPKKVAITKAPQQMTRRKMTSSTKRVDRDDAHIVESIEQDKAKKMGGNRNKDGKSFSHK